MKQGLLRNERKKLRLFGGGNGGAHPWQTVEFLDFILEGGSSLIAVVSLDGKRLYCNAAYRAHVGNDTPSHETDVLQDFHPEDRHRAKQLLQDSIRTGIGRRAQLRLLSRDGIVRLVETVGRILRDSAARPSYIILLLQDVTEQREAEHRLRLLAHTATSTRDMVVITDLAGQVLFANDSFLKATGYSEGAVMGKSVFDFLCPSVPQEVRDTLQRVKAVGEWSGELAGLRVDGTSFPVEGSVSLMRDEADAPIALFGVARDITERKRSDRALRNERDFSSAILNTVGALVVVLDRSGKIVRFNRTAEDATGYRYEEVQGKHVWDLFILPEEVETIKNVFKNLRSGQFPSQHDNCWVTRSGKLKLISWSNTALLDVDGAVEYVIATGIDVTDRELTRQALESSEQQYKHLFEGVNDAIVVFESAGEIILEVNQKACEMYGFTREELVGKSLKEITKDIRKGEETIDKALREGGLKNYETTHYTKLGTPIEVLSNASVIDFKGHRALLSINRDITERRRAEKVEGALYRISRAANATRNLPELFQAIHTIVAELIYAKNLYVALYDRETDLLSFSYFVDECDEWGPPRKPEKGLTEHVLRTGEPLLVSQELFEELVAAGEVELIGQPSVDWLGVPLKGKDGTFGVLVIQSYDERQRYAEEDKEILKFVSTQIAMAIERKQGEEALRESEERYRRIYNKTPVMLQSVDPEGRIISVSDYWLSALGYERSEVIGRPVSDFLTGQSAGYATTVVIPECARKGSCQDVPLQCVKKNGEVIDVVLSAITERGEAGESVHTLAVLIDVTQRKRAEDALQHSEEHFRSLIENASDVISVLTLNGSFYYVSPSMRRALGYKPEELIGRNAFDFVHPDDVAYMKDYLQRVLLFPGQAQTAVYRFQDKNGSWRVMEGVGQRIVDHAGVVSIVSNSRDITERREAENALRQSEKRYRTLFETMAQGVLYRDAEGRIISANPAAEKILGLSLDQMQGRTSLDPYRRAIHEDGTPFPGEIEPAILALRTGVSVHDVVMGVFHLQREEYRWIKIDAIPQFRPGEDMPYQVYSTFDDISERKNAEKALAESEDRFRRLAEQSPDIIFRRGPGGMEYISPSCVAISGFAPEEYYADPKLSFNQIHPDDRARFSEIDAQLQKGFARCDLRILHKDGHVVWTEQNLIPVYDPSGKRIAVEGVVRDISDRKRAEEERARLSSAIEQAAESVIITDANALVLYVNPAFERITGYSREEAVGQNPRILKSGQHDARFYRAMWETLLEGETWTGHLTNKRKDGSLFEEDVAISPVRDGTGAVVNYVAVKRDVTQEKQMEHQLRQAQKMESLGQLAGGIAHDFNNVLGVILGSLELLKSSVNDEKLHKYVDIGENSVQRGADVAKRLLTFARAEEPRLVPLLIEDVIKELLRVLEHSIEKTIEIRSDIAADLPIVEGDHGQLYQMLLNLCVNARDAILDPEVGKKTGTISIRASLADAAEVKQRFLQPASGPFIKLSVSDDGMGMSAEVRQRIFEPFFTTKLTGKGTGLGLAVVYGVVKTHRGFTDVESEPGVGTTFVIYLPASTVERRKKEERKVEEVRGGDETILVVEDEEAMRLLLTELLHSRGYKVIAAPDGIRGLEMYKAHDYEIDAVITDMGLPKLSGQDLFARIMEINPSARVILASGYLEPHLKSKLFNAGAKAFVQKPYHVQEVLKTTREVLDVS
jgi:two-component system cell cycle sensor histidine kinase/response regulator CckA